MLCISDEQASDDVKGNNNDNSNANMLKYDPGQGPSSNINNKESKGRQGIDAVQNVSSALQGAVTNFIEIDLNINAGCTFRKYVC